MVRKILVLGLALIMCVGIFTACTDYGYEFHFSVVGENGTISPDPKWKWEKPSPIILMGNKKGQQIMFVAAPNSGYQVKEWKFNGKTVDGNKSNSFTAKVDSYKQAKNTITVEFEPIH